VIARYLICGARTCLAECGDSCKFDGGSFFLDACGQEGFKSGTKGWIWLFRLAAVLHPNKNRSHCIFSEAEFFRPQLLAG